MTDERSILDMFGVTLEFLTEVVMANSSLRGVIIGYLAERKLWDVFGLDARITAIRKDDDHDRENKGDLVITYLGHDFRFEVKSLQTNSIKMFNSATGKWMPKIIHQAQPEVTGQKRKKKKWVECELFRNVWQEGGYSSRFKGKVQCDASDNREIGLPNGNRVKATNLKVGEFDILAVGLFAFREQWDFGFMLNRDLPRTTSSKFKEEDWPYLLKTLIPVEWPLSDTCVTDPFVLMDQLIEEKQRTTA